MGIPSYLVFIINAICNEKSSSLSYTLGLPLPCMLVV